MPLGSFKIYTVGTLLRPTAAAAVADAGSAPLLLLLLLVRRKFTEYANALSGGSVCTFQ
jgi:hypothetical protein